MQPARAAPGSPGSGGRHHSPPLPCPCRRQGKSQPLSPSVCFSIQAKLYIELFCRSGETSGRRRSIGVSVAAAAAPAG